MAVGREQTAVTRQHAAGGREISTEDVDGITADEPIVGRPQKIVPQLFEAHGGVALSGRPEEADHLPVGPHGGTLSAIQDAEGHASHYLLELSGVGLPIPQNPGKAFAGIGINCRSLALQSFHVDGQAMQAG